MNEELNNQISVPISFGTNWYPTIGIESVRKGSVISWGKDNLYPNYIKKLNSKSTMHSRILESKNQMISGNGWNSVGLTEDLLNNADSVYDLNDVLYEATDSLTEIGGLYLKVFWSVDRTRVAKIECIPYQNVRIVTPDSFCPEDIEWFDVSDDYTQLNRFKQSRYHVYNEEFKWEYPVQIYYWKRNKTGFYPEPSWISAIEVIELEHKLDRYHLKSVINGFHLGKFITFIGPPVNPEEKEAQIRAIRLAIEGEENTNKSFFWYARDKDHVPIFNDLSTMNVDNTKYITLQNSRVNQAVMTAHGVTDPSLFCVSEAGQMGNTGGKEMISALNIFQSIVINPMQKILEDIFNYLLNSNLTINKFKIYSNIDLTLSDILSIVNDVNMSVELKQTILEMGGLDPQIIKKLTITNV